MKKKNFLKDVMHEINMLKLHATNEEKSKLDFKDFNFQEDQKCIYGLLTGCCTSDRAKELMDISCKRVMDLRHGVESIAYSNIEDEKFVINGKYSGQTWGAHWGNTYNRCYSYLSALEAYICTNGANVKGIMNYMKNDIKITL